MRVGVGGWLECGGDKWQVGDASCPGADWWALGGPRLRPVPLLGSSLPVSMQVESP